MKTTFTTQPRANGKKCLPPKNPGAGETCSLDPDNCEEDKHVCQKNSADRFVCHVKEGGNCLLGGEVELACAGELICEPSETTVTPTTNKDAPIEKQCVVEISNCTKYDNAGEKCKTCSEGYEIDADKCKKAGLSGGVIAGIVIGVIVVAGIAGALIWYFMFYKKRSTILPIENGVP